MKHEYSVHIVWSKEDEAYLAIVPELAGCMADGTTPEEALANIREIAQEWVKTATEKRREIPKPMSFEDCEQAQREFQKQLGKHIQKEVAEAVQHILDRVLHEGCVPWSRRSSIVIDKPVLGR